MCNLIAYSKTSVTLQNICLQDTNFIEDTGVQNARKTPKNTYKTPTKYL